MPFWNPQTGRVNHIKIRENDIYVDAPSYAWHRDILYDLSCGTKLVPIRREPLSATEIEEIAAAEKKQREQVKASLFEKSLAGITGEIRIFGVDKKLSLGMVAYLASKDLSLLDHKKSAINAGLMVEALLRNGAEIPLLHPEIQTSAIMHDINLGIQRSGKSYSIKSALGQNLKEAMEQYGSDNLLIAHYRPECSTPNNMSPHGLFVYKTQDPSIVELVQRDRIDGEKSRATTELLRLPAAIKLILNRGREGWYSSFVDPFAKDELGLPALEHQYSNETLARIQEEEEDRWKMEAERNDAIARSLGYNDDAERSHVEALEKADIETELQRWSDDVAEGRDPGPGPSERRFRNFRR